MITFVEGRPARLGPAAEAEGHPDRRMRALHDTYAAALYRFLLRLSCGRRQLAEDLLQETLLRAWRHLDKLDVDIESLGPWLFTVARRIAIDAGRARRSRPTEVVVTDVNAMPAAVDEIDRALTAHTVRDALELLSPEHRSVLVEIYLNGRSSKEAAAHLGIPEGTAKSRRHNALRSLRTRLAEA